MTNEYANHKILVDDGAGLAGEFDQERQAAQVIVHQRNGGAVNGHLAPGRAHGDAQIARRQRRGVVDPVPDHRHPISLGFDLADKFNLVLRQAFGRHLFAADFGGHPRRHRLAVAGDHGHAAHAAALQFGQRFARFGAGLVLQSHPADALAVAGDKDQAEALRFIQINRAGNILRHALIS